MERRHKLPTNAFPECIISPTIITNAPFSVLASTPLPRIKRLTSNTAGVYSSTSIASPP